MALPLVVITRRLPGGALDRLPEVARVEVWPERLSPSPAELRRLAADAGLITKLTDRVDSQLLDACPDLHVVANVAVGWMAPLPSAPRAMCSRSR